MTPIELTDDASDETGTVPTPAMVAKHIAPRRLTQEDVDREVTRALRDAKGSLKPADYDEVKAAAESTGELERKISHLEQEIASTRLDSLRTSIAARFGVADADRDLFMTAADEATLLLQAERLGSSTQRLGNVAPREGGTVQAYTNRADRDMREFVSDLFGTDPY